MQLVNSFLNVFWFIGRQYLKNDTNFLLNISIKVNISIFNEIVKNKIWFYYNAKPDMIIPMIIPTLFGSAIFIF